MNDIRQAVDSLRVAQARAKQEVARLDTAIRALQGLAGGGAVGPRRAGPKKRRKVSADTRRRMAVAQRARWARVRKQKSA